MAATTSIAIQGLHCQNCVNSVTAKLKALPGVQSVEVSLDKGEAVIAGSGVDMDAVRTAIDELGFEPGEVKTL